MKQFEVILSDNAIDMLEEHLSFIWKVDEAKARKTNAEIFKGIFSLDTLPERCPYMENEILPRGKYHKLLIAKWYLILYQIRGGIVYVDAIIDCRQDPDWLSL